MCALLSYSFKEWREEGRRFPRKPTEHSKVDNASKLIEEVDLSAAEEVPLPHAVYEPQPPDAPGTCNSRNLSNSLRFS